jgi:hypothetical protein
MNQLLVITFFILVFRHSLTLSAILVASGGHRQRLRLGRFVAALRTRHRFVLVVSEKTNQTKSSLNVPTVKKIVSFANNCYTIKHITSGALMQYFNLFCPFLGT